MGDVASGAGPIIVAHPNPHPQPEDFQMRGTPQLSVPSIRPPVVRPPVIHPPVIRPPVVHPQIGIATIVITAVIVLSIVIPSIAVPAIIIPAIIVPPSVIPAIDLSPLGATTVLLNRIVSLEIELQEVTEALEAMTQSRDEARLALGNILAALNTIVENTQLGGT
ncbi:hypothetical protein BS47DRAFT_1357712 [Hydnum rufescens UP504]|uniref:Uncharacterized protein n=1 Tax=Hydnum rufescens UP504 TaxID=1448309 RepID=A0A9P6E1X0_9AGAM|nr:hypothetical protein BS47DRAFT_1357712 [Hydnum rufescens UP504]